MSPPMSGAHAYQRTATDTASPERVLAMLFQRARQRMAAADEEFGAGEIAKGTSLLRDAIDIVCELQVSLDPSRAPELTAQLDAVYGFVLQRLQVAVARGDRGALADASRAFLPIADAFEQAIALQGR